jgi:hypothetical protein
MKVIIQSRLQSKSPINENRRDFLGLWFTMGDKVFHLYSVSGKGLSMSKLLRLFGRLLCQLGIHDFRIIDQTFGFSAGGGTETVECKRCAVTMRRQV